MTKHGAIALFDKLMHDWRFTPEQAAAIIGDETSVPGERLRSFLRTAADLDGLYQDDRAVIEWLDEPFAWLEHQTPRATLATGDFTKIERVRYVVAGLSGR